jgi:hypothetical protein
VWTTASVVSVCVGEAKTGLLGGTYSSSESAQHTRGSVQCASPVLADKTVSPGSVMKLINDCKLHPSYIIWET